MSNFREMTPQWLQEKILTFKVLSQHITYSFEARDLEISNMNYFCEISKFRDFMNTLRNFAKSVFVHMSSKFKYFAKQFILTESPDHVL